MWVCFRILHNVWPEEARRLLKWLEDNTNVSASRIEKNLDFYYESIRVSSKSQESQEHKKKMWNKLIFFETDYLRSHRNGKRINLLPAETVIARSEYLSWLIGNTRLRSAVILMARAVIRWEIDRIHILHAGKRNCMKEELFTLNGSGTMVEWNFNPIIDGASDRDIPIILDLLQSYKYAKLLKPRNKAYLEENWKRFRVARIDGIPVGCVEIIPFSATIIELGGIAVNVWFLDFRIWKRLIEKVEEEAFLQSKDIVVVTNNLKLIWMLEARWYMEAWQLFPERILRSPGKQLYLKLIM